MTQFEFAEQLREDARKRGHEDVRIVVRCVAAEDADAAQDSLRFQYLGCVGERRGTAPSECECFVGVALLPNLDGWRFGFGK